MGSTSLKLIYLTNPHQRQLEFLLGSLADRQEPPVHTTAPATLLIHFVVHSIKLPLNLRFAS